jgi:rRNA-processing protein FCF1
MEAHRVRNDKIGMPMTPKPMKRTAGVILDSNALFVPLQFKIDIFTELETFLNRSFELILLSPIRREIERLAEEGSPKMRKNASFALKLVGKCKLVEIDEIGASPDDIIVKVARDWDCPVFTNDKALRKRLRDINVPVIYVRQKSHLEIDGRL